MKPYDIVELKNNEKYFNNKDKCLGVIIKFLGDYCEVLFLNNNNWGDYAYKKVETSDLICLDKFSVSKLNELKTFISKLDIYNHKEFKVNSVKEYDLVEVTVEKESYAKHGVHKGMRGVVMQNHAVMNKWNVIFTDFETGEDIADILINEDDLKIVKE